MELYRTTRVEGEIGREVTHDGATTHGERERKGGNACAVEHTQLTTNGAIQNNKSRGRDRERGYT